MRCEDVSDYLPELCANRLDAQTAERLRGHLASCPRCQAEADRVTETAEWVRAAFNHFAGEPRADLAHEVLEGMPQGQGSKQRRSSVRTGPAALRASRASTRKSRGRGPEIYRYRGAIPVWIPAAAVAAVAVLALALFVNWQSGRPVRTARSGHSASRGSQAPGSGTQIPHSSPERGIAATRPGATRVARDTRFATTRTARQPAPADPSPREEIQAPPALPPLAGLPERKTQPAPSLPRVPRLVRGGRGPKSEPAPGRPSGAGPTAPETPSERPLARLAGLEGLVMVRRGGRGPWLKAQDGLWLMAGDQIDTRTGKARVDAQRHPYEGKGERKIASLHASSHTIFRLSTAQAQAVLVDLRRGQIYVEDGGGAAIHVETPDGLIVPVGTVFGVRSVPASTTVVVASGAVEIRTKPRVAKPRVAKPRVAKPAGARGADPKARTWIGPAVRIEAGEQAVIRRGRQPVRKALAPQSLAWGLPRARRGLQVLYLFGEGRGPTVRDVSGTGRPLDLTLRGSGYRWLAGGGLAFPGGNHNTIASHAGPARKLYDGALATSELTLEAWVRVGRLWQEGPSRILAYDHPSGGNTRNWALNFGSPINVRKTDPNRPWNGVVNFRLRTANTRRGLLHIDLYTEDNAVPGTAAIYHLVGTYRREEGMRIYVNGVQKASRREDGVFVSADRRPTDRGAWDPSYKLALGNRTKILDRDFHGVIYLAAIYNRALTPLEVERNFAAGPKPGPLAGR